jgi:hypothetical protein
VGSASSRSSGSGRPLRTDSPVGAGREASLGLLDRLQLGLEILADALVQLVLVEVGGEIARVRAVARLPVVLMSRLRDRALQPRPFGAEQLACAVGVQAAA